MIWIAFLSSGLLYSIWIFSEYISFTNESKAIRQQYIADHKQTLKMEVNRVIDYVEYMRNQIPVRLKEDIKKRVAQAHDIAMNIYEVNKHEKSDDEIKRMVKDALRPIRFNNGRGYYFAFSMDGIEELFADSPEWEGTNMLSVKDRRGNFVVRDMIDLLRKKKEGHYRYFWSKPGDIDTPFEKIAFVKYFEPFDWGIGTGEYVDDVKIQVQNEVLRRISQQRFGKEGYFFGSLYGGDPLFTNGKITKGTKNLWTLTDPNGLKLIQEQNRIIKKPGGGFVTYFWEKLDSPDPVEKLSYVTDIPQWHWIIGAGVYLDTIDAAIMAKRQILVKDFLTKTAISLLLFLFLSTFIFFRVNRQTRTIQSDIKRFSTFLEKASIESKFIDSKKLKFNEFEQIALSVNKMLDNQLSAVKALKLSEKRYAAITNSALDAIFIKDENRRYTFTNPAMAALFNCGPEDLIGKKPEDLFKGNAAAVIKEVDDRTFNGESVSEIRTISVGDEPFIFHTIQIPLEVEDGRVVSISGIVRDITQTQKAAREKLISEQRAAEQEKHAIVGQIAGKISHDFNNILGVIMGNTELALIDCENPELRRTLELIYGQTRRGKNLTKNLMAFAKDQEPKQEFFHIHEKIDLVISLMKKELESIKLSRAYQGDLPEVLADPGMIEHAVVNLVQNAVHALSSTAQPEIIIRTDLYNSQIRLQIEDNGCGIPDEHLPYIFEPSFSLKGRNDKINAYSPMIKGTGYGLANVKKYIEQHKGTIEVESEMNKGTVFSISLPITQKELTPKEIRSLSTREMMVNKSILIVEDEIAISDVQYRILTGAPCRHKVDVAHNGKMASDLISRNKYDCISLDYILPGDISGMDIYISLRETHPDLPVLFISGNIEFLESIKDLKQDDAHLEHLSKPCGNTEYIEAINKLLAPDISMSLT